MYAGRIVESGPTSIILTSPRHPYTHALLAALPRSDGSDEVLSPIPGHLGPPHRWPQGCASHPRCQYRRSGCSKVVPDLVAVGSGQQHACLVDPLVPTRPRNRRPQRSVPPGRPAAGAGRRQRTAGGPRPSDGIGGRIGQWEVVSRQGGGGGLKPTAGRVMFNGEPVQVLGARARPKSQTALQMVFQNPFESLNPRRRIGSQILDGSGHPGSAEMMPVNAGCRSFRATGPARARRREISSPVQRRAAAADRDRAGAGRLAVDHRAGRAIGLARRVAQAQLANTLRMLIDRLEVGLLLISHDLAIVRHVADDLSVMYLGQGLESGPTSEVWSGISTPIRKRSSQPSRSLTARGSCRRLP